MSSCVRACIRPCVLVHVAVCVRVCIHVFICVHPYVLSCVIDTHTCSQSINHHFHLCQKKTLQEILGTCSIRSIKAFIENILIHIESTLENKTLKSRPYDSVLFCRIRLFFRIWFFAHLHSVGVILQTDMPCKH